jgi:outer membrane protein
MARNWQYFLSLIFAAGLFSVAIPGQAEAQSLRDTLVAAYKNSNLLEQNRALLRATDESAAVALSALRPVVSFAASASAIDPIPSGADRLNASASLSARMTLHDGGNAQLGLDVAKETILATRQALLQVEQQVLLQAASAFFGYRNALTGVELQTKHLELVERELQATKDRFEVGEVSRTEVALAEARLAGVKSGLAAAQGALARARQDYRAAVGKFPTSSGASGGLPVPAKSLQAAESVALRSNPAIRQAQHEVKVADLNVARARTAFKPTVDLSGSVAVDDDADTSGSVALSVNQTLYAGGQRSALTRQAIAQREAARAGLLQTTMGVRQGVGNAWSDQEVVASSLKASQEETRAAELVFAGMKEEASLGARTTLDVLEAEQDLLDAQSNLSSAQNDQFVVAYALLAQMGRMTAKDLNLGIAVYDPAAYYNSVKEAPQLSDRGMKLDKLLKAIGNK